MGSCLSGWRTRSLQRKRWSYGGEPYARFYARACGLCPGSRPPRPVRSPPLRILNVLRLLVLGLTQCATDRCSNDTRRLNDRTRRLLLEVRHPARDEDRHMGKGKPAHLTWRRPLKLNRTF